MWGRARSGEAMSVGLLQKAQVSELFLVVALTMALTPLLAELGARLGKTFEKSDVKVRPCPHIPPQAILSPLHAGHPSDWLWASVFGKLLMVLVSSTGAAGNRGPD